MKKSISIIFSLFLNALIWAQPFDVTSYEAILYCDDMEGAKVAGWYFDDAFHSDSNFTFYDAFLNAAEVHVLDFGFGHFIVDSTGQLWGKGQNQIGYLGFGHKEPVPMFVAHEGFSQVGDVAVFTNGLSAICINDGALWLFGVGSSDLFAMDSTLQGSHISPIQLFDTITMATQIAVGNKHGLIVMKDGTLWGWGNANEGRLGDKYVGYLDEPKPLGRRSIKEIAIGSDHSLVLDPNGTAYAFGLNFYGPCGIDPDLAYFVKEPNQLPIDSIITISAGRLNSYLVRANGEVYALGTGGFGGIGNGDSVGTNYEPVLMNFPEPIVAIKAENFIGLALAESGNYYGFGLDTKGQFGQNKTGYNQYTPVLIDPSCTAVGVTEHTTSMLTVSPNPSQDGLFSLSGFETSIPWQVYSVLGHRVASGKGSKVDLSMQPTGMYLLTAGEARVKLVVE